MDHLIDGYRRFRATTYQSNRALYETLATKGQKPATMIIGATICALAAAVTLVIVQRRDRVTAAAAKSA